MHFAGKTTTGNELPETIQWQLVAKVDHRQQNLQLFVVGKRVIDVPRLVRRNHIACAQNRHLPASWAN